MKSQISYFKFQIKAIKCIIVIIILLGVMMAVPVSAAKWGGVDESVVEKYAEEYGRAPVDPLINTDQGDLLLFMFLLGGIVGGFAAGYYWRTLTEVRPRTVKCCSGKEKNSAGL